MKVLLGLICIAFGLFGWLGQMISVIHFPLAQRLGLQEKSEDTDRLFRIAERNTAKWDTCVLWTLVAAGILMLLDHSWWPYVSLLAGGIYLDTAGREAAKYLALNRAGVRIGTSKDHKIAAGCFSVMAAIALWLIAYSLWTLAS